MAKETRTEKSPSEGNTRPAQVNNPAYKGASPEMVGRALLRNTRDSKPNQNADNKKGDPKAA